PGRRIPARGRRAPGRCPAHAGRGRRVEGGRAFRGRAREDGRALMKPRPTTRQMYRGTASLDALPETLQRAKPKPPRSKRGQALVPVVLGLAVVLFAGGAWFGRRAIAHGFSSLELGRARVTVSGNEYLSPDEVRQASGLPERVSFF